MEILPPLPWVPTTNTYYRYVGAGRAIISPRGRQYREQVVALVQLHRQRKAPHTGPLTLRAYFCRPDRRRRDLDNLKKGLLDSLKYAGVYEDDSQIEHIESRLLDFTGGPESGLVFVQVGPLEPHTLITVDLLNPKK